MRTPMVLAGCLAGALLVAAVPGAAERGLRFEERTKEVGLADPGFGWHGYHDGIVCADWDGDGDVDVLVVVSPFEKSAKGNQARLFVNLLAETGKLVFEDQTDKLLPGGIGKEIVADSAPFFFDVNNDGRLDICSISDEHAPYTFINDKGVFRMEKWGFHAQSCALRDVNGNGLIDVIGLDTGTLYINEGGGKFRLSKDKKKVELSGHMPRDGRLPVPAGITVDEEAKTKAAKKGHVYYHWRKTDINGDGQDDYVLTLDESYGFKLSRFYVKTGQGYKDFTAETGLPTNTKLKFLDVDGDGIADAVSTGERNHAGVFLGDGKGHFKKVDDPETAKLFSITSGGCYTTPQAVLDLDGDGKPDILTFQPRIGSGSALLRGLGGGKFQKLLLTGASSGQAIADLNNDGLPDIVCSGQPRSKGLHVWLNTTPQPGNWLKVQLSGPKQTPFAVTAEIDAFPSGADAAASKSIAHGVVRSAGLPVHLGLGATATVDVRIRLGDKVVRELKGVTTRQLLKVNLTDDAK